MDITGIDGFASQRCEEIKTQGHSPLGTAKHDVGFTLQYIVTEYYLPDSSTFKQVDGERFLDENRPRFSQFNSKLKLLPYLENRN